VTGLKGRRNEMISVAEEGPCILRYLFIGAFGNYRRKSGVARRGSGIETSVLSYDGTSTLIDATSVVWA